MPKVPRERWDAVSFTNANMERGASKTSRASLFPLEVMQGFDSAYFGINPDEAQRMDPQHRLCLMGQQHFFQSFKCFID